LFHTYTLIRRREEEEGQQERRGGADTVPCNGTPAGNNWSDCSAPLLEGVSIP